MAGSRVLVAVSGGADSVALLLALRGLAKRYQLDLVVGHFNHGWRGLESDADELFVVRTLPWLELAMLGGATKRRVRTCRGIRPSRTVCLF